MGTSSSFTITEWIHAGQEVDLYRGYRNADRLPITIKRLKGEHASALHVARLRHEFLITRDLDLDGAVRAYSLETDSDGLALLLEDFGGRPLRDFIERERLDLSAILLLAASLAGTLGALHARRIIHKDIKPSNILIHVETGRCKLTDFGIATRLSQETLRLQSPDLLEGTLAYMSPEQTGRMNRPLDFRTDLYSLGVTLYELLSGSLPFPATAPMELVHSHIARAPMPLHERAPDVPVAVSAVVMKLLAKAAEDRYQSGLGLKADLEECLAAWQKGQQITPFPLGQHDVTGELRIPEKLFGREREIAALLAAFEAARQGAPRCLLLTGYAGIGKSALVHEVHKSIAQKGGTFAAGKFDQIRQSAPYGAVALALRELVRSILTGGAEVLDAVREQIQAAVAPSGQILVDLIPELALILGPQPPAPALGPIEAQNRFALIFLRFLRVLSTFGGPLVLFLDDLQWADPASLKLLHALLTDPALSHFLLIGAYRDAEVSAGHPLSQAIGALRSAGVAVESLALGPLGRQDIERLLAEALGSGAPPLGSLAAILADKTLGNPFFLRQMLRALADDGQISFDARARRWTWDEAQIQGQAVTSNVVELMARKLLRLAPETQRALKLAACIGHTFDLRTLSVIFEASQAATNAALWEALREGLVLPLDATYQLVHEEDASPEARAPSSPGFEISYRFLHDRVQQAAYALVEDGQRAAVHLRIGRLIQAQRGELPADEGRFDVVDHKNLGAAQIVDPEERLDLARLNLAAGKKAKASAAYAAAASYLRAGVSLLGEAAFARAYELAFELFAERAQCEAIEGHFEQAESLGDVLLREARTRLERARVAKLRIDLFTTQTHFADALRVFREGLALFGIALPVAREEISAAFEAEIAKVTENMAARSLAELTRAPMLRDPDQRALIDLLVAVHTPAYLVDPMIAGLVFAMRVNVCLQYGPAEDAAYVYASYGFVLLAKGGRAAEAYALWKLAFELREASADAVLRAKTDMTLASTAPAWKPLRTALSYCARATHSSLEEGDFTTMSHTESLANTFRFDAGEELSVVREHLDRGLELLQRTHDAMTTMVLKTLQQATASLLGRTRGRGSLDDDAFDEARFIARAEADGYRYVGCYYYTVKLQLAVLFGAYEEALSLGTKAEERSDSASGIYFATEIPFYMSLTLLALASTAAPADRERYLSRLASSRARVAELAAQCPANYLHKHLLLAAEEARLRGSTAEAAELYDQAIAAAHEQQFTQHEALGDELAARFYLARGRDKLARAYLLDARRGYLLWGATEKAEDLEQRYPMWLNAPPGGQERLSATTITTTGRAGAETLDVATVLRVAQTITGEIVLDRLLERVMRDVIENAGAERGLLLLEREGRLFIEARISTNPDVLSVGLAIPAHESAELPQTIAQFVERTREPVVLGDAAREPRFAADPYVVAHKPRSILCVAMAHQGRLVGILYLENNMAPDVFTPRRVELGALLGSQAAIAAQNALLLADLQRRTEALHDANERLQQWFAERAALERELMRVQTPVIPITEEILVMPLVGAIDETRAHLVLETALRGVEARRAAVVILDITGVPAVDAGVAETLLRIARALRLLGAEAVITGISPAVAQALVGLGLDHGGLITRGTLQGGIAFAMNRRRGR